MAKKWVFERNQIGLVDKTLAMYLKGNMVKSCWRHF